MKVVFVYSKSRPIICISGMWKIRELCNISKFVPDAFIVKSGEPILELSEGEYDILKIVNVLRKYVALSTELANYRLILGTDKRLFISEDIVYNNSVSYIRAAYCAGIDGIVVKIGSVEVPDSTVNIIEIRGLEREYIYTELENLKNIDRENVKKVHGIIIKLNTKPTIDLIRNIRDKIYTWYSKTRIIIALSHIYLSLSTLKKIRKYIYGICLLSTGNNVYLEFSDLDRELLLYRCTNCNRDYITNMKIRKCVKCGERLIELLKDYQERYFRYNCRELKYIFLSNLKNIALKPGIEYLE